LSNSAQHPTSRRAFIALTGAALTTAIGSGLPGTATAAAMAFQDQQMMSYLDQAAWVPQGTPNVRQIYIGSAPWCPACQALHRRLASYNGDVQFRWIQAYARDTNNQAQNRSAAFWRVPDVLDAVYETGKIKPADSAEAQWMADWNEGVINALRNTIKARVGKYATPILFWETKGGIEVTFGAKADFDRIIQQIVARPQARDIVPAATLFPAKVLQDKAIQPTNLFASKGAVTLYAVPSRSAPALWRLDARTGAASNRIVTTRNGQQWAHFNLWKAGKVFTGGWASLEEVFLNGGRPASF
tara:strand:- start:1028 stop:1927 length:900 start_codon:yes stop_codon:yes gene_type:complete